MRRQTGNDAEGAYAAQLEVDEARLRGTTSQLVVPFERREAGATPAGVDVDVDRPWFEARYDFVLQPSPGRRRSDGAAGAETRGPCEGAGCTWSDLDRADEGQGMRDELRDLRARLRKFVDTEVIPAEDAFFVQQEQGGTAPSGVLAGLRASAKRQGLWALGHPVEIGGAGVPFLDFVPLNEVIGRSELGQLAVGSVSMQDSIMLHTYGSEEQKRRWLAPMVAGEILPSVGLTEPEVAGSDPTLMRASARREGDEWVVNAHKWFTTGANSAAFTTVFCETEPEAASPHRRFSAIVVPTDTPGYELVRVVPTMGHVGGGHCEIRLTDVRVPYENLLGGRGEGFVIAQRRLGPGRIFHCMRWLGQAERAFELMCARANERYAHGSLLSEKGEIQRYVAESAAQIQAHRLMTLDAARALDAGDEARIEISLIKFAGAQMLHDVIDRAIQVHGALGVTADTPLERMYREARYARIYDGPDEVHRMVVARRLLRDPAAAPWA